MTASDTDFEQATSGQFGPYLLRELINTGGMAEIWLATDPNGKCVAIRRLMNGSLFNFTEKKRFVRGCEILSQIHNHEHVIGYIEHGKISGAHYLAMEYVALAARDKWHPVLLSAKNVACMFVSNACDPL